MTKTSIRSTDIRCVPFTFAVSATRLMLVVLLALASLEGLGK